MWHADSDNTKQRLTEYADILIAINMLRLRGLEDEELIVEITKLFYVDLDAYEEVLRAA